MIDYQLFNTLEDCIRPYLFHRNYHHHLFCKSGTMSFIRNGKLHTMRSGDFLVWQTTNAISDFSYSKDFDADLLLVSNPFLKRLNPEKDWASIGYMFIKTNPLFHLDLDEMKILEADINQFRHRTSVSKANFREDLAEEMVKALVYDIWNIYSREIVRYRIDDTKSEHILRLLMLAQEYTPEQRDVSWYAGKLDITPKHLTEICKETTGRPAGDWIDNFAAQGLEKLLSDQRLTLSDIIKQLHFSQHPSFTRYVKRVLHTTPSALQLAHQMEYQS